MSTQLTTFEANVFLNVMDKESSKDKSNGKRKINILPENLVYQVCLLFLLRLVKLSKYLYLVLKSMQNDNYHVSFNYDVVSNELLLSNSWAAEGKGSKKIL
ncbi:hypothetical protein AMECASPLE_031553 [Ameca splendens]|uniref:Uncharacterized protein n=1 Tax=Ameca splendens TaxID=208324 RepID=A0ABV1ACN8_9TELE